MIRAIAATAAALATAACTGAVGTVHIELAEPPGSGLLDQIASARLTLTVPRKVVEAERDADGNLSLEVELPAVGLVDLQAGDTLLLCTDGLTRHLSDERITELLGHSTDAAGACRELVDEALAGGGHVNVTVVVARMQSERET